MSREEAEKDGFQAGYDRSTLCTLDFRQDELDRLSARAFESGHVATWYAAFERGLNV